MARPPRIQLEGACYHIFHRGNRRERIFWNDADYATFEEYMIEAMNWSGVKLFDWSQLPNHYHMLLETPEGNISEFMQRLGTRYAKYFNGIHRKVGHVFQGRYRARLCDKENYFMELIRYVELNPYRLKKGKLAELGQWKWSSLRYHLGQEEAPEGMKAAMKEILDRFGPTLEVARTNLAKYLADGLKEGNWEEFYQAKAGRFLGSEAFLERVKSRVEEPVRQERRELTRVLGVSDLGEQVQSCFSVKQEELERGDKERRLSRIRKAFVEVARTRYRFSVKALGEYLKRSESAISRMVRRRWEQKQDLPETMRLLRWLEQVVKPSHSTENGSTKTGQTMVNGEGTQ